MEGSEAEIRRQCGAIGAGRYELGVLGPDGRMLIERRTEEAIVARRGWLARRNGMGAHVYVRPLGSVGVVLVDDVSRESLRTMGREGVVPATVVQTSPDSYQAWVRVAAGPIPEAEATAVARLLAERYGGDTRAASWRHFGRLAGFMNVKACHRREDGTYPWARVRSAMGGVAPAGDALLMEARALLASGVDHRASMVEGGGLRGLGDAQEVRAALEGRGGAGA